MILTFLMLIPHPSLSSRDEDETFGLHNFELQAMLKRVVHSLGLVEQHTDKKGPRRKNKARGTKASPDFSLRSKKDFVVRIVHQGGQLEEYPHAVPASKLMAKYPGMCVARPEVFRAPHQSVLWPEERLLLGHKYIIISSKDVEKLKRKHAQQGKTKENGKTSVPNGVTGQEMIDTRISLSPNGCKIQENSKVKEANGVEEKKVNAKMNQSQGGGAVEESIFSAKDFVVPKEKSTIHSRRKGIKGTKPFEPPLPKARSYQGVGWQPSLPTVQELSP